MNNFQNMWHKLFRNWAYVLKDNPDRYELILPWKYEVKRNER